MTPDTTTPGNRVSIKDAVLALPNILKLLARLVRDPRVDRRRRLVALGAVAYAASPVDLIPEAIPVLGKVDDLVVAVLAVRMLLDGAEEDLLAEHWDGSPEVLEIFDDVVGWVAGLVPRRIGWAFSRLVAR
jgi:uncharacterized membrane protein YkvA (DUF1232 family)